MKAWPCLLSACAIVAVAEPSRAQSDIVVKTDVSEPVVEVGQEFRLQFTVLAASDEAAPQQPRLPNVRGAVVRGPSLSTQTSVSMRNGRIDQRQGFTATWAITPQRLGDLRIGPPSAVVGQRTVQGTAKVVKVVKTGQAPSRRQFDPFDMFRRRGSPFGPLFGDPLDAVPDDNDIVLDYPPEFRVERAPDPVAFLRSTLSPKKAVVGEQVTLTIYAYGNRGRFDEFTHSEPKAADFVSLPIVETSEHQRKYQVDIGDDVWNAVKLRELALFPLRTGELSVGGMKTGFNGRGYLQGNQPLSRTSEFITVRVSEPPLQGRPPGYRIGDVGRYRLKADVTPRKVEQGGAVAVNVTLSGVGNLPTKLEVPQRKGVEWLEPRLTGDLEPQGSIIRGERQFAYVVRLHESGPVDLGELSLPHYDPKSKSYRQATVALGRVEVSPSPDARERKANEGDESTSLSERLEVRQRLSGNADTPWHWTDSRWFWALVGLSPLSVLGFAGSLRVGRRVSARLRAKKQSAATVATKALGEARRALADADPTRAAAETERALFSAVEAATQVKARGILREELTAHLVAHGLAEDVATRLTQILESCEAARFRGSADGGFTARHLDDAAGLVRELSRAGKTKTKPKASPSPGASA